MKKILSSLLVAVMSLSVMASSVNAVETVSADFGAEIEAYAAENEGKYASFGAAVFVGEDVVYSGHFGEIDRENSVKADDDTVYEWGSISKLFVWVSAMQLYEQGKLDLNENVRAYLPEGFFKKLSYDEPITMLNLMNHNAGWQETVFGLEVADEADIIPLGEALKACEPAQVNKPGEITAYSNWGAALAGYIVECVSGQDYAEYVRENILQPLGMEHTSVAADYRDNEWVRTQREKAKAYVVMEQMGQVVDMPMDTCMSYILLYPAGSVTGTLADLTAFGQAFVSDDCLLFEKQETLDLMLSASSFYGDGVTPRNNHGLWNDFYAVDVMGHGGNTQGFSANLMFDPVSKTGVAVVTNQMGESLMCSGIPQLVFGDAADNPRMAGGEITERSDISGYYVSARGILKGWAKMISYLSLFGATPTEDEDVYSVLGLAKLTRIADDTYIFEQDSQKTVIFGGRTSDDAPLLQVSFTDYMYDGTFMLKFIWVFATAAIGIIYLVFLIINLCMLKKRKGDAAAKLALLGQGGIVLSVLTVALYFLVFPFSSVGTVIMSIIVMLSMLAMVAAAVLLIKNVFTSKEMKISVKVRHIITAIFCVLTTAFLLYFELYAFWI